MTYNELIAVEQHFRSNGHDFNRDTKFNITKRKETITITTIAATTATTTKLKRGKNALDNITEITKKHKNKWVMSLQTFN